MCIYLYMIHAMYIKPSNYMVQRQINKKKKKKSSCIGV